MTLTKKTKFAFDIGTNSLGWAVFSLDKDNQIEGLLKTGVRIFSDGRVPKTGAPLGLGRRVARGIRRRRDRFLRRSKVLVEKLVSLALMPPTEQDRQALKGMDVYALRNKAIQEAIEPYALGRILYHLNQRRGFKSNRKSGNTKNESKINAPKILKLHEHLSTNNFPTVGSYLHSLTRTKNSLRFNSGSSFYADRALYEDEFDKIISTQSEFHPGIAKEDWAKLKSIIYYQRPLRSKEESVGKCELYPKETRSPKASIYFQRYRLLQSLANLKAINADGRKCEIDINDKITLYSILKCKKEMTFDAIRKKLNLEKDISFNLEHQKTILGDDVSKDLKEILEDFSGKSLEELDQIVGVLCADSSEEETIQNLKNLNMSDLEIEDLLDLSLPEGYCSFSKKALEIIVPKLEELFCSPELIIQGIQGKNVQRELRSCLEYYGKILPASVCGGNEQGKNEEALYGKISNPTVHTALNQVRKVANELIQIYGTPLEVAIGVTRDLKNSKEKKDLILKIQNENQRNNKRIKDLIISEHNIERPSREDIIKYKLWEELGGNNVNDRICPYSLVIIPASKLFTEEIEVGHILPFARTLDDSISNKTLAYSSKNREKGRRSPHEAFGEMTEYELILVNAKKFPKNKMNRFLPGAMERYLDENEFLNRHLNDTAYISKITKKYMDTISNNVYGVPGRLTALIRHHLGLNTIINSINLKNRDNNKHHAVDAVVIGITTRSYLQKIARQSEAANLKIDIKPPITNFRDEVQSSINSLIVSRKEDHSTCAALHEGTYYGIIGTNSSNYEKKHNYNLVTRKPIDTIKEKDIKSIRSSSIRREMEKNGFENTMSLLKSAGTKRLRLLKTDKSVVGIWHPLARPQYLKGIIPGENHSLEVWKVPKFKDTFTTHLGKVITCDQYYLVFIVYNYFERALKTLKRPHPAATKFLTLCKNDNVSFMDKQKVFKLMNVSSIKPSGNLIRVVPLDSATREEHESEGVSFSQFHIKELRKVKITPSGKTMGTQNPYV